MSESKKYDTGKTRWDLVPIDVIEEIAKVYSFGADKYGANTWQGLDNARDRYYAALLRHLVAWRKGETTDPESGLPHLAHVGFNIIALLWGDKNATKNN